MPHPDSPFARYVREVTAHLYDLTPHQRHAIAGELYTHLEELAAERGTSPDDPQVQTEVIRHFGSSQRVGRDFARAYHAPLALVWWRALLHMLVRAEVSALLVIVGVLCGWAAHDLPPPVSDATVTEIAAPFAALDQRCCDDTLITLHGYQATFFVNSDLLPLLDNEQLRALRPGERVVLTLYKRWEPQPNQRIAVPVVGIRSERGVLLERAAVAPARAYSQPVFAAGSLVAGALCLLILVLHITRSSSRRATLSF